MRPSPPSPRTPALRRLAAAVLGAGLLACPLPATAGPAAAPASLAPAALAPATVATAPAAASYDAQQRRRNARGPAVGVQFHGMWSSYSDPERAEVLDRLVEMGAGWVRLDMSWSMIQPTAGRIDPQGWGVRFVDRVVDMAAERGLKVLATFWLTPDWADPEAGARSLPADPRDYGRALAWAAERWQGEVNAWEVWNEPNSEDFLAGADAAAYADLLCAGYDAVQASSARGTDVVFGGTMHNDSTWIEAAYDAGAGDCFDVLATHPYQSPSDTGPLSGSGEAHWEFSHLGEVRDLMRRHGDRRPVWVTEFGWSSHRDRGDEQPWERGVSKRQQAEFTVAALEALRTRFPFVKKAFLYNERARTDAGRHMKGYGLMTNGIKPKPVYRAVQAWTGR